MLTKCGSQSEGYNWAKLICTKDATQTPEEISINQDQMEKQTNYKPINKNFICHIASDRCAIFTL